MGLALVLDFFQHLAEIVSLGLRPTLAAVCAHPTLLLRPTALADTLFANIWAKFGDMMDEGGRAEKTRLITPHARGVVLDVGAGRGHTAAYLDHAKVTRYVALEPNALMHGALRAAAAAHGFAEADGTFVLLGCGAEDTEQIVGALDAHAVDTVISFLSCCGVPRSRAAIDGIMQTVLKPGGELLFHEHVQSALPDIRWWQTVLTLFWKPFMGCSLDRPTDKYFKSACKWKACEMWAVEDQPGDNLFWRTTGRFVKEDDCPDK